MVVRPLLPLALVALLAAGCAGAPSVGTAGATEGFPAPSLVSPSLVSPSPSTASAPAPTDDPTTATAPASPAPSPVPTTVLAADPGGPTLAIQVQSGIAFESGVDCGSAGRCDLDLDVWSPTSPGPWPTIVLFRGGPGGSRSGLTPFAQELAARGAIVFNADYRDRADQGGGWPNSFADVACAVRFARRQVAGDGSGSLAVTVVGHSLGGYVGSVAALTAPGGLPGSCGADPLSRVDGFVGLAGAYAIDSPEVADDFSLFFGPDGDTAGRAADPIALVSAAAPPISLLAEQLDGTVDPTASERLRQALGSVGADVPLRLLTGGGHGAIVDPDVDGPTSATTVIAFARAVASGAASR